jgi:hypothetical protein
MVPIAPTNNESSLQTFFDGRMPAEPIDALAQASSEPATFSPRCGFQAELVLSQSSAPAGLAWYNVPSDPEVVPSELFMLVPETTQPGAMVSSNQIRSDPKYAGGSVGFALTKNGGKPVYYSESMRNPLCTACSMPGHWKLMLAYASPLEATTYYLAWEDWEGANESSWPDDGDFNDKVFKLKGVRCAGGGESCDTGMPGACSQGLTGCSTGASPAACSPLEAASAELCDGVDNDCDARVDEGNPCPSGDACVQGHCTRACGGVEFGCEDGLACVEGQCVDPACAGVSCEIGQVCEAGACKAPCQDVRCPLAQVCRSGLCKDPCVEVECQNGSVCRDGACLESCACSGCPDARSCEAKSGKCVDPGCADKTCPEGQACTGGQCVDACQNARCPHGVGCSQGRCENTGPPPSAASTASKPLIGVAAGSGGTTGAGHDGAAGAKATTTQSQLATTPQAGQVAPRGVTGRLRSTTSDCGCRAIHGDRSPHGLLGAVLGVALLTRLRRRRRRTAST